MNKRQFKRQVCFEAALVLQNAIDSGWEYDDGKTEAEVLRWESGMRELIDELHRRGRK